MVFSFFTKSNRLKAEKNRLEAFLSAVPGEYCGWSESGMIAYSQGFCGLLGLDQVKTITDVQSALNTADSAVLEGMFIRLQEKGKDFQFVCKNYAEDRAFKLSGARGQDLDGEESFYVLWLEDVTDFIQEKELESQARIKAEESEHKLQTLLDAMPVPLWMRDSKAALKWCNKAYAAVVDSSVATVIAEQKELPGTSLAKKDAGANNAHIVMAQDVLSTGKAQSDQRHVVVNGKRRLMNIHELPLRQYEQTLGYAEDVTREEELGAELKRFIGANNELLEQLRSAIGIYDAETRLEFYNAAYAQLWGLEEKWLNTKPKLSEILEKLRETRRLPEQADFRAFKQSWLDMFKTLIQPSEDMLYLPDGSVLRMLVVPHQVGGLIMIFEDVTSRLELESSYNTLIEVQKETLDNLTEGVAVWGGDGRLQLSNPSFGKLWGLHPEDLDGKPHISKLVEKKKPYFDTKEWPKRKEELISYALEREERSGRIARNDDTLLEYVTVPLPDGGVLIAYFDITDKMRVERALLEKNAALEEAERVKLDFLANVSYQLRTPLNAIMGFAEILANQYFGELNERQAEYTTGMLDAGERLLSLINDILDLSTIEAGYLSLNPDDVNVSDIVKTVHDLTKEWAQSQDIKIKISAPAKIGKIVADERRMKQVLLNLISNAISFTEPGGTISVKAERHDDNVSITVSDTGIGISKEDQERIFAPFERAKDNKRGKGAGLGLSLVKNIVELHGGSVEIESESGKGTKIICRFPLKARIEAQKDSLERQTA